MWTHSGESHNKSAEGVRVARSQSLRQKDREKNVTLPVIVKVDNAGFQSYFLLEKPAFLFILLSWRETKTWI